ncbi:MULTISPECIES: APC family permease [unclassified Pseudonocardia]|uniref:APC family permease n=1 Tax=unclassified Pseudonocardia TaxID=2619320 RepID=UPI0001FFDEF9|nr:MULTISPECIES: APC family permease [unclassified Pseudonocardia]ALE76216.1 amino acid permease [Pseudonocardia sp. EC080625-04]ALL85119.1 amino acid permease [Pseudonocardia sp. EC080619-01]OLM18557.1 Amino acid permease-associated region [Pseudonocardia sp. Ae707_Ps1]
MTRQDDQGFVKVLGRADVLAVGFGAMIGFGWVVLAGDWVSGAGTAGAALAFVLGGGVMAVVGLTYAELVSAMPKAGGEHHYVLRALGSRWAFVASWAMVLGYLSVVAFEAVALPETALYLFPDLQAGLLWTVAGYDVHATWALVGIAGAVVVTWLNYIGIRPAAVAQTVAVAFLVGVAFVMLTGIAAGGSAATAEPWFTGGVAGMLGVLVAVPFLFVGFDVIPQSAEEIRLPERHIGRLLVVSVLMAIAFYVVIVLGTGAALGDDELAGSQLAAADAMATLWGHPAFGTLLVLGGIAGILTSWNAFLIGASRLVYAMAASGMLPRWFAVVHPRHRTPSHAVLFIGGLSVLAPLFGDSMLTWLVNAGGITITMGFTMVAVTFLVLRRREPALERPFRVSGGPVVGTVAAVAGLVLFSLYLPGMPAALGAPEWIIVGGWWVVGLWFLTRFPEVGPGVDAEERLVRATGR